MTRRSDGINKERTHDRTHYMTKEIHNEITK